MLNLEELRAFVAVVDTGSIVAAARSLKTARATLRRRLDDIETRAGVQLLHRTARGAIPTQAGKLLADRGRNILREANALVSSVREVGADPAGVLRFLLPIGLPPQIVTPLFKTLRQRHPRLSFQVRFSSDPLGGLMDDADVVAYFGSRSPGEGWMSYELIPVPERLLASGDYLRRNGTPATPEALSEHDLLAWDAPDGDPAVWATWQGRTLPVEPKLISTDIHFLRCCAEAGMGIALLPDARFPASPDTGSALLPVLPDEVGRARPFQVVVPSNLADLPRIQAVVAGIQAFLKQ